jgi:carboxyl-terminal processing protease
VVQVLYATGVLLVVCVLCLAVAATGHRPQARAAADRLPADTLLVEAAVLDAAPLRAVAPQAGGAGPTLSPSGERALSAADARALFNQALDIIMDYAYEAQDPEALVEAAIRGMLQVMGDRHAAYYPPKEYGGFLAGLEGEYGGIGAHITVEGGYVVIFNTIPGTPAERAGLQPGDQIFAVDGQDVRGLALGAVADLIRGEPGTKVTLTVNRPGVGIMVIPVVRAVIELTSVEVEELGPGVGYVRILSFDKDTSREFREALEELKAGGMKGLVLDLRDNPGGILGEVIRVAESFVPPGYPVLHVDRGSRGLLTYRSCAELLDPIGPLPEPDHPTWSGPLVVLVNGRTASGAELLAGALQDWELGVLVGTRTFGKGSVQSIFDLFNDGGLKITTALDTTARGRDFEEVGLTPDVVVEDTPSEPPWTQHIFLPTEWTFREGHVGSDVVLIQKRLAELGYDPGPADGVFDADTRAALEAFERRAGLSADGVADPDTLRALNAAALRDHPAGEGLPDEGPGGDKEPADPVLERGLEILKNLMDGR